MQKTGRARRSLRLFESSYREAAESSASMIRATKLFEDDFDSAALESSLHKDNKCQQWHLQRCLHEAAFDEGISPAVFDDSVFFRLENDSLVATEDISPASIEEVLPATGDDPELFIQNMLEPTSVEDFLPAKRDYLERLSLIRKYGTKITNFEFIVLAFVLPIQALAICCHSHLLADLDKKIDELKQLVLKFISRNEDEGRGLTLAIGTSRSFKYPIPPFQMTRSDDLSLYLTRRLHGNDTSEGNTVPKITWNPSHKSINIFGKGYKCILTGEELPDLCFITPLYWNETSDERRLTRSQLASYHSMFFDGPGADALVARDACSLEPWNMICLSSRLRRLWYECRFGLKYVGSKDKGADKEVYVEFVWMPYMPGSDTWEMANLCDEANFNRENARIFDKIQREGQICREQIRDIHGRKIVSGSTFSLHVREEDFRLFTTMLKLQWNLVRLAAMSGMAQAMFDEPQRPRTPSDIWTPGSSEADESEALAIPQ